VDTAEVVPVQQDEEVAGESTKPSESPSNRLISESSVALGRLGPARAAPPSASGLLVMPARKKSDCRSFHRIPAPFTRSNLEIDDDILGSILQNSIWPNFLFFDKFPLSNFRQISTQKDL
jgi:hypothetical protein